MITIHVFIIPLLLVVESKVLPNVPNENPLVELPLGKIEGTVRTSVKGKDFFSFEGVPYAKPPVGQNRFEVRI